MSETNDLPVPQPGDEDQAPVVQPRLEESFEWVIATYRKHQLKRVSAWLDENLGSGDRSKNHIPPVLLDINPIEHRQSLQEQVFPSPRVIHEPLLDAGQLKVTLEAGSGMGKTTFLKLYQESLLQSEPHPDYSLPVYFYLGVLPEGSGFSRFFEFCFKEILEVVLLEKEESEDLVLDEKILAHTIESLARASRMLILADGLDQLNPEDRFNIYCEMLVDDNTMRSNFLVLASRSFNFGPLATDAVILKGQASAFRMAFERIDESERDAYLGEALLHNETGKLFAYAPELSETPILLRMIRTLHDAGKLDDLKSRGDIYTAYFNHLLEAGEPEGGKEWIEQCLNRIGEISLQLVEEERVQRFEDFETGYEKDVLKKVGDPLLVEERIPPALEGIFQQTLTRWEFRHPSFQEYFSARELAKSPDWKTVARTRCRDMKWEETLKFVAGMVPSTELYEILLDEGAVFLAGNAVRETRDLSEPYRLLVGQLLKFQCRETLPQFARSRLIKTRDVTQAWEPELLKTLLVKFLKREKRDSRILFGVLEMLLAPRGIDLHEMIDTQDFEPLQKIEELRDFLSESKDPEKVNPKILKRWGEMVTIPEGKFIWQEEEDEEDQIYLKEYSIMKFPVTNILYREFDPNHRSRFPLYSCEDDQPVVGVNYFEALVFSVWLGKRLPVEKEWEKASRGTDGRDYPWGEAMGYQAGYANTCDFLIGRTTPVTEFELGVSAYGCFDMAGNVWEWSVQLNSSKHTTLKIVRGGSWLNYLVHAKCKFRNSFDPAERHLAVGFRCVSGPRVTEIEDPDDKDESGEDE